MALSDTEFQRLQEQLLELRTLNYHLQEENHRLQRGHENGIAKSTGSTPTKPKPKLDDPFAAANKFLSRATGGLKSNHQVQPAELANGQHKATSQQDECAALHKEVDTLRQALATQEEQFHLQQMTMKHELEQLQQQNGELKDKVSNAPCPVEIKETQSNGTDESENDAVCPGECALQAKEQIKTLNEEIEAAKLEVAQKNAQIDLLSKENETVKHEKESLIKDHKTVVDQYHLMQERNDENEEHKLQVGRLTSESEAYVTEINKMSTELTTMKHKLEETNTECDRVKGELAEAQEKCVSTEKILDETQKIAEERKQLVDQMAKHVEKVKDECQAELKCKQDEFDHKLTEAESATAAIKMQSVELEETAKLQSSAQIELDQLKTKLDEAHQEIAMEKTMNQQKMDGFKLAYENAMTGHGEELQQLKFAHDEKISELQSDIDYMRSENAQLKERCDILNQEAVDKGEAITVVEKKFKGMMKELSRQITSEKKRNEKLEEKLRELSNTDYLHVRNTHSASPAQGSFEEVKTVDCDIKRANDTGSVCSWQMVTDNGRNNSFGSVKTATMINNNDGAESICSNSHLDTDTTELIMKVTQLQRERYEMMEKLHAMERSFALMGKELNTKSKIIEQYIKEKQTTEVSLKDKVVNLMKVDLSAADIHQMNRQLQLMLEEALMKNMALERNLETLAKDLEGYQKAEKEKVST